VWHNCTSSTQIVVSISIRDTTTDKRAHTPRTTPAVKMTTVALRHKDDLRGIVIASNDRSPYTQMTAGNSGTTLAKFRTKDPSRKAICDVIGGLHTNREKYNWMWRVASKSPMLTKKPAKDANGKPLKRYTQQGNLIVKTKRLCPSNSYKVLLSGAAAEAYRIMTADAQALRVHVDTESSYCPLMPMMSDGALLNFEHVLVALCQTYFARAIALKKSVPLTKKEKETNVQKKVTAKMQTEACASINDQIQRASGIGPGVVQMSARGKPPKSAKRVRKGRNDTMPADVETAVEVEVDDARLDDEPMP